MVGCKHLGWIFRLAHFIGTLSSRCFCSLKGRTHQNLSICCYFSGVQLGAVLISKIFIIPNVTRNFYSRFYFKCLWVRQTSIASLVSLPFLLEVENIGSTYFESSRIMPLPL